MESLLPYENRGLGLTGYVGAGSLVPSETLGSLPSPVTVADYISRAESQSRQRPPLERTKPSEDSLSGQKVGRKDIIYFFPHFCSFGAGSTRLFPKKSLAKLWRKLCLIAFRVHLE